MIEPYVKQTIKNGIGYIEFYHPAHNPLPSDLLKKLTSAIADAGVNSDIKIIVLKSGGDKTFCAGASFNELIGIDNAETGREFFSGFANVINAMRECPKFIIGRIQGKAVGGGVGLAAAADYCMATEFAEIKLSELSVGIGPFVVGPAIERKIGLSAFSQIAMDANTFYPAEWAKQKGLFTQVFKTANEMDDAIIAFSESLSAYNPDAMLALKTVFWKGTEHWNQLLLERAEISGKLVLSKFTKEKLKDFK